MCAIRHSKYRIGEHTCTNQTVPYGTALLGGHLSQALRAGLRSHRPSGTFSQQLWLALKRVPEGQISVAYGVTGGRNIG
jgi:hypothetical protein